MPRFPSRLPVYPPLLLDFIGTYRCLLCVCAPFARLSWLPPRIRPSTVTRSLRSHATLTTESVVLRYHNSVSSWLLIRNAPSFSFEQECGTVPPSDRLLMCRYSAAVKLDVASWTNCNLPWRSIAEFFSRTCSSPALDGLLPPQRCHVRTSVRCACCGGSTGNLLAFGRFVRDPRTRHLCGCWVVPW